ncbi:MAG: zinc ribbon domain-containing protein [Candidatus Hodarchaeota archaeon]
MINEKLICLNCKKEIPSNASYCPHCGLKLKISLQAKNIIRICRKCGTNIVTLKLSYCPICLTDLESPRVYKK